MYKIIGADQKEYGPITQDQIRQWISEGRINAQSLVLPEGGTQWVPASSVPELSPLFSAVPPLPAGSPPPLAAQQPKVPNYLVQSILVTLCCCLPLGVVAIVYSAQVNGKLQAGDYQGAVESSNKAKMWAWIGFGIGIVLNLIVGAIQFAATMKNIH